MQDVTDTARGGSDPSRLLESGLPIESALHEMWKGERKWSDKRIQVELSDMAGTMLRRMYEMARDMGRAPFSGRGTSGQSSDHGLGNVTDTFVGKRAKYESWFKNDFSDLRNDESTIFFLAKGWRALNDPRRAILRYAGRIWSYFFSVGPWFRLTPDTHTRSDEVEKLQRHQARAAERNHIPEKMRPTIQHCPVLGEYRVKTTFRNETSSYWNHEMVLVDGAGEVVLVGDLSEPVNPGDWTPHEEDLARYLEEKELYEQEMAAAEEGGIEPPEPPVPVYKCCRLDSILILQGQDIYKTDEVGEDGRPVLGAMLHAQCNFQQKLVQRRRTVRRGAVPEGIYYQDLLFELQNPDAMEKGTVVHLYDLSMAEIAKRFNRPDLMAEDQGENKSEKAKDNKLFHEELAAWTKDSWQKISKALNIPTEHTNWLTDDANDRMLSARNQARPGLGEGDIGDNDTARHTAASRRGLIAEGYIQADVDGDGEYEDILLILLLNEGKLSDPRILYWNFVGAIGLPDGARPFDWWAWEDIDGRQYGRGIYEQVEEKFLDIEQTWAQIEFLTSTANNLKAMPDLNELFDNVEDDGRPQIGAGVFNQWRQDVWDQFASKDPEYLKRVFQFVPLVETNKLKYLEGRLQQQRAALNLELGMTNEAESADKGIQSSETATGVDSNMETEDMLLNPHLGAFHIFANSVMSKVIALNVRYMGAKETFAYQQGKKWMTDTITRREVEYLSWEIDMAMTKRAQSRQLNLGNQAIDILSKSIAALQTLIAMNLAPTEELENMARMIAQATVQQLKAIEFQDVDEDSISMAKTIVETIQAMQEAQAQASKQAQQQQPEGMTV